MADNLTADDNRPWHVEIPDVDIEFDVDAVYLAKDLTISQAGPSSKTIGTRSSP